MSEAEIKEQIDGEFQNFLYSKYSGKLSIPKNIHELFKKGIMDMPPFAHKINFHKVKNVAETALAELTFDDLNDMIKIILSTKPKEFYTYFDEAVKEHIKFEKFVLEYNQIISEFQKSLEQKKVTLRSLTSGIANRSKIVALA